MTTQVVWICSRCDLPVSVTADVTRLAPGEYRIHFAEHQAAHLRQHRG